MTKNDDEDQRSVFIFDEDSAERVLDLIYKLIDAYREMLESRRFTVPSKLDFGFKEVDFHKSISSVLDKETEESGNDDD